MANYRVMIQADIVHNIPLPFGGHCICNILDYTIKNDWLRNSGCTFVEKSHLQHEHEIKKTKLLFNWQKYISGEYSFMANKRHSAAIGRCGKKVNFGCCVCICAGGLCESLISQWEGGIGAVMGAAVQCVWVSENSTHCYTTMLLQNSTALTHCTTRFYYRVKDKSR